MTFAEVMLWGSKVGTVAFPDESNFAKFRYDSDFLHSGIEVAPIAMPLSPRQYSFPALPIETFRGLPGLLADSLPDRFGNAVINHWLAAQGRTPESFNAVERLCYIGQRGMGALEFKPVTGPKVDESEKIYIDSLVKLASEILTKRSEMRFTVDNHVMQQIMQVGTSAGGARAKAVIAWNEETNDIRSGQVEAGKGYDYWIIKFDGITNNGDHNEKDPPTYTRIEYAYHLMAKAVGIQMNECKLYRENRLYHFMTKRFDRIENSGKKLHMQTLGAMAHYDFNDETATSYEMAAGIMRRLNLPYDQMEQLCLRMIFNVLTMNCDDHVKNISFLMDRNGIWSLAPAYDLTFAYNETNRWLKAHQMSVNNKRMDITESDMIACASAMDVSESRCRQMIKTVKEVLEEFDSFAIKAELPSSTVESIKEQFKTIA